MAIVVLRRMGSREELVTFLSNTGILGPLLGLQRSIDHTETMILTSAVAALPVGSAQHTAEMQEVPQLLPVQD